MFWQDKNIIFLEWQTKSCYYWLGEGLHFPVVVSVVSSFCNKLLVPASDTLYKLTSTSADVMFYLTCLYFL